MVSNSPPNEVIAEDKVQKSSLWIGTEPLWTVEDVAHYLRLKPETVRMMARRGELPSIKMGRVWRFKTSQVKDWLVTNQK